MFYEIPQQFFYKIKVKKYIVFKYKMTFINQNLFQYTILNAISHIIIDVNHVSVKFQTDTIPNFASTYLQKYFPDEKNI